MLAIYGQLSVWDKNYQVRMNWQLRNGAYDKYKNLGKRLQGATLKVYILLDSPR